MHSSSCSTRSCFLLLLSTTLAWAEPKLLPVDESARASDFAKFKKDLAAAVEKRDAKFVDSILTADALASFGGDRGTEGFKHTYAFNDPNAPFWRELQIVLALGGTFSRARKEFTAPYVASRWPAEFDLLEYVALTKKDVAVRTAASADSKEVARLSYSILKLAPESQPSDHAEWTAINLPAGGIGFVPAFAVRSPLDYRAQFRRAGTKWKLASFLAGN